MFEATDPDWKGSRYDVQVEWDDPVTCAAYAKEHDLLANEGWKRFKNHAKKDKVKLEPQKRARFGKSEDPKHVWLPNP